MDMCGFSFELNKVLKVLFCVFVDNLYDVFFGKLLIELVFCCDWLFMRIIVGWRCEE